MKLFILSLLIGGCLWTLTGLKALAQPGTTMYVNGRFLYSAVGEKVVFRGVNEMFVYSTDKQGVTTLPQIAQTGANVVRICWNTSGSASDLDALLGNAIANKIIPIVQLDNITGNLYSLQTCLDYWKRADVLTAINKYKKWALLNIANEAGDNNTTDAQFQSAYIDAVAQLRGVGYTIPLVIDAPGYGQNESIIVNTWSAILQSDPQHNLVFSVHPYWKDSNTQTIQTRFSNLINTVVSQNIPFMFGEGPQPTGWDCSTQIPYSWVMQQCQTNQIGWMVWTWGKVQDGTNGCGTTFDVTTNGNYGSWSNTWGQAIAVSDPNSIQNTSVRPPSIFGNTPADTQAPTAPTGLTVSNVTATGATLTWAASTDNVGVTGYNVYAGTTLLTSSATTSITLSGLVCNTAYAFTVKAKDGAGNVSGSSNTANATTSTCPAGEVVYSDALNSNWEDWTWSAYRYFNNTSPVQQGTNSIKVDYGGYGGFSVRRNSPITTTPNMVIKFWVYSSGANNLKVYTQAADSGGESSVVTFSTNANQWKEISLTMAALGNPSAIKRINIQENAGNSSTIFYDYIRFESGTPTPDTQAPTALTNLAASSITPTGLTLSWTASTDNIGVTSYHVYRGTTLLNGNVTGTTYTVSGLTCATGYAFSVKAKDAAGNVSSASNTANATTSACPDTQAPTAPTTLIASAVTSSGLTLTWNASTDNVGVTGYLVYQGATLLNGNVTGTTYAVSGLTCATAYAFTVRARDAAGNNSAASNTANVTTSACSANELVVYNEALGTDWQDWSWNTSDNLNNTSPVQVGSKSAKVDYYSYGGFSLRKGTSATTSGNTIIRFWVRSQGNTPIRVYTTSTDDGGDTPGYTFTTASNQWQEISVNMSQLGNPAQIKRLNFQNYSSNNATVYYDNIRLISVSGAREAAEQSEEVSELLVYPNPSDGIVTVNYVAQQAEPVQIRVVNASGTAVQNQNEQANPGENAFKVDMRQRNAGWYLIQLQGSIDSYTRKVLIQR